MITFRNAWPDELDRALGICPDRGELDCCFLAIEDTPVERIVGVAFWRPRGPVATSEETRAVGPGAEFCWRMLPRYAKTETERELIRQLQQATREQARACWLKTANMLLSSGEEAASLRDAGFAATAVNRVFVCSLEQVRKQHERLRRVFGPLDPAGFSLVPPAAAHREALKALVTRQGLVREPELEHTLAHPLSPRRAFDLEWSFVLVDATTARAVGALLAKIENGALTVTALAIESSPALPTGRGWHALMERWLQTCAERGWTADYYFRVNPATSASMLKITAQLGSREVGQHSTYAIAIEAGDAAATTN